VLGIHFCQKLPYDGTVKTRSSSSASGSASLEKGLALFGRIMRDGGRTPLPELAADMALPRSTLYRLTSALEQAGLIARLGTGRYGVGLPLAETLQDITPASQLIHLCRPSLRRLADDCSATAHLGVMENEMVTYLVKESVSTPHAAASFTRENAQLEAYCSGIGKVLLAWLPEMELTRYLSSGPFVALTERTITDPATLRECLQAIKATQFARDDGEIADDLYCLAVPLWTDGEPMTVAISLSFTRCEATASNDAAYLAKMRACAAALSIKLGK
jgi:IclR family acetate operon transcriptional repressor